MGFTRRNSLIIGFALLITVILPIPPQQTTSSTQTPYSWKPKVTLELNYLGENEFSRNYILNIRNQDNVTLVYGLGYGIEMLILGQWHDITIPHGVIAIAYALKPGSNGILNVEFPLLLPGTYRVVLPVSIEGYSSEYPIYSEFGVGFDPAADLILVVVIVLLVLFLRWVRLPRKAVSKPVYSPVTRAQ